MESKYSKYTEVYQRAQKTYQRKRRALIDSFKSVPCMDCGVVYPPYVMDFDHLPENEKSFTIGSYLNRDLDKLMDEIEKCDVVCSNCHRIRTYSRKNGD